MKKLLFLILLLPLLAGAQICRTNIAFSDRYTGFNKLFLLWEFVPKQDIKITKLSKVYLNTTFPIVPEKCQVSVIQDGKIVYQSEVLTHPLAQNDFCSIRAKEGQTIYFRIEYTFHDPMPLPMAMVDTWPDIGGCYISDNGKDWHQNPEFEITQ